MGGKPRLRGPKKGFTYSPEMVKRRLGRIDFDKIVQRLEDTASAGEGPLTNNQLHAITLLMDRIAPKLTATELSGQVERTTVIRAPETVADSKTWLDRYGPAQPEPEQPKDKMN